MKALITIALSLLISIATTAQNYLTQARPFDKKEWGYINQKGDFIIDAKYRKCFKFSEGYAPIYEGKKFFFINPKGEQLKTEVGNLKLFNVFGIGMQEFSDGMVPVIVGKKWGYLNTNGELAIGLKYEKALKFDDGFAIARKNGEFYVVDKRGEESMIGGAVDVKHFSEGLAPFRAANKKFGYIGTDGATVIQAQFASVGYFIDGLAWAKTMGKKVGFINKKGEWVIQPKFIAAKDFDPVSGLAMVKETEKWVYTNKSGETKTIIAERNHSFKNGFAAAKKGDKWGFINEKGEWVIEPTFGGVKDMELIK